MGRGGFGVSSQKRNAATRVTSKRGASILDIASRRTIVTLLRDGSTNPHTPASCRGLNDFRGNLYDSWTCRIRARLDRDPCRTSGARLPLVSVLDSRIVCNRYELHYRLDADLQALAGLKWQLEFTSCNVCPTQSVPVIRSIDGERRGDLIRRGLVPFFAKGEPGKFLTTNARIETVTTSPSYRGPWKRGQRCLQLASGFYERHTDDTGRKAPFHITVVDQRSHRSGTVL
jgi:hypothetical protein